MSKTLKFCQNLIFGQKLDFGHLFPISEYVVISVCVLGFLSGLSMCTSGGYYMFTLIDDKSASWNLLLVAFLEVILVGWIYGADRFLDNIKEKFSFEIDLGHTAPSAANLAASSSATTPHLQTDTHHAQHPPSKARALPSSSSWQVHPKSRTHAALRHGPLASQRSAKSIEASASKTAAESPPARSRSQATRHPPRPHLP